MGHLSPLKIYLHLKWEHPVAGIQIVFCGKRKNDVNLQLFSEFLLVLGPTCSYNGDIGIVISLTFFEKLLS